VKKVKKSNADAIVGDPLPSAAFRIPRHFARFCGDSN
jgi:hypothetical protein